MMPSPHKPTPNESLEFLPVEQSSIYNGFGISSLIVAFLITLTGVYYFFDFNKVKLAKYWFWGSLVMIWISVFFGFFSKINPLFSGIIGFEINDILQDYLGLIGTVLLMIFLLIVYLVIRMKLTPEHLTNVIKKTKKDIKSDFNSEGNLTETIKEEVIVNPIKEKEIVSWNNSMYSYLKKENKRFSTSNSIDISLFEVSLIFCRNYHNEKGNPKFGLGLDLGGGMNYIKYLILAGENYSKKSTLFKIDENGNSINSLDDPVLFVSVFRFFA